LGHAHPERRQALPEFTPDPIVRNQEAPPCRALQVAEPIRWHATNLAAMYDPRNRCVRTHVHTRETTPERKHTMTFEIGIMTFGEVTADPTTGTIRTPHQRARETIELARVADEAGLDVFGMGEHHRSDFVGSAPTVMLAAAAEATRQIRLASAVTVLSSDDPVRVWEQFATIDLLSAGRAEIIAG